MIIFFLSSETVFFLKRATRSKHWKVISVNAFFNLGRKAEKNPRKTQQKYGVFDWFKRYSSLSLILITWGKYLIPKHSPLPLNLFSRHQHWGKRLISKRSLNVRFPSRYLLVDSSSSSSLTCGKPSLISSSCLICGENFLRISRNIHPLLTPSLFLETQPVFFLTRL